MYITSSSYSPNLKPKKPTILANFLFYIFLNFDVDNYSIASRNISASKNIIAPVGIYILTFI